MKHWPRSEYFQPIFQSMKEGGYSLLSWVTMNSVSCRYHVKLYGESQHSRLFFNAHRRALVVMFEYTQHEGLRTGERQAINWNYIQGYWSIKIWYHFNAKRHLEEWSRLTSHARSEGSVSIYPGFDISKYYAPSACDDSEINPHFEHMGSGFSSLEFDQSQESIQPPHDLLDTRELTFPTVQLLRDIGPYLHQTFRQLDVSAFPPVYCFPDSAEVFWSGFRKDLLPQLGSIKGGPRN